MSLGIKNIFLISFVILNPIEMAENGQKLGNYRYVSPKDFRGCLLVHGLFSNFSIGNFFHSYEFFKAIHILCQKTNGSGPILKKVEDMSY